jgi:hypothetical protein
LTVRRKTINATEELSLVVEQLQATLKVLDRMQAPELVRPNIPQGAPVTEELAYWATRIYAYSILCQFREMLRSALFLYEAGQVPAVFLCCRSMFEMAAHAYYVKKHTFQHLDKKDCKATWEFLFGINQGSRHMRERQKASGDSGPEIVEGPHIAKVIACFDEYFYEQRKDKPATQNYSFISEFCHPNSFAFTNHLEFKEPKEGVSVRVTFSKPTTDICIQVLPDALFSCMPLLLSMDELLRRIGDKGFSEAVHEFAKIF